MPPRRFRPANQRSVARLGAVQALYQMDIGGGGLSQVVAEFEAYRLGRELDGEHYRDADHAYFRSIVAGVVAEQRTLDPAIHAALVEGWPLTRIDATVRAILRCGAHELKQRNDVPPVVIVTEYVEIAGAFYEGEEPKLVNAVLDTLARNWRGGDMTDERRGKAPNTAGKGRSARVTRRRPSKSRDTAP